MLRDFRRPARTVIAALTLAVATASCGIKGPLKPPPKAPPADATGAADPKPPERKAPAQ